MFLKQFLERPSVLLTKQYSLKLKIPVKLISLTSIFLNKDVFYLLHSSMHLIAYRCHIWPEKLFLGNSSVCTVENYFQSALLLFVKARESPCLSAYVSIWSSVTNISYSTRLLTKQWEETLACVWDVCVTGYVIVYIEAEGDWLSVWSYNISVDVLCTRVKFTWL